MTDYISRKAAIGAVEIVDFYKGSGIVPSGYASDAIRALPAADVRENKRGKCTNEARYFFCSECGYGVQDVFEGNYANENEVLLFERGKEWNFCPNCGADMREEKT